MTARKTCECPGCHRHVRVTKAGRLFKHRRLSLLGTVTVTMGDCRWSGEPAPTEGEQEAGR